MYYVEGISNVKASLISFSTIQELVSKRRVRVSFDTTHTTKFHQIYVAYDFVTVTDEVGKTYADFWTVEEHVDVVVVAVDTATKLTDYSKEIFPVLPRKARRYFTWPMEGTAPWLNWLNFFANDGTGNIDYNNPLNLIPVLMSGSYGQDIPEGAEGEWISDEFVDGAYDLGCKVLDAASNVSRKTEDYCVHVTAYPTAPSLLQVDSYDSGSNFLTLNWN